MTTPTLDELNETYNAAWEKAGGDEVAAMIAVIETHFVPMLAEAYFRGRRSATDFNDDQQNVYADRIKRLILEPRE